MGAIAETFKAYVQPLLDQTDGSEEQLGKALALSQLCFNLALLPEGDREQSLKEMQSSLQMDDEEFDDFRHSVVLPMIRRHQSMFPHMHSRDSNDGWQSGPATTASSARLTRGARGEAYPGTERYAACPCGSGRKYKFCCGKKGD